MKNLIGDKKGSEIGKESLAKIVSNGDKKVDEITNIMFSGKRKNAFQGRMIIRCDADGKKYLYDIIDIKKKRSTPHEQ